MTRLCFLHIEKAAGSTIHEIFRNNFLFYYVAWPYKYDITYSNQNSYLSKKEFNNINLFVPCLKAFGGHSIRLYEKYGNCSLIAFVRNLIERYFSHYYYQKNVMGICGLLRNISMRKILIILCVKKILERTVLKVQINF